MPSVARHPAVSSVVTVSASSLKAAPVATLIREDAVAVVLEGDGCRYVAIAERRGDEWKAPEYLTGQGGLLTAPRGTITERYDPLPQMSTTAMAWPDSAGGRPDWVWFALTALAGHDVVDVVTSSDLDECRAAVQSDGSLLHLLRVPTGTWPEISVTTRDGRALPVHRDKRSYNESSQPDGT